MFRKFFGVLVASAFLFSGAVQAEDESFQRIVIDRDGNPVASTFRPCVYTRWSAEYEECVRTAQKPVASSSEGRSFLVFFDFDRSSLTNDAKDILSSLKQGLNNMAATFTVVGHADRSGPDAYNMALSKRRAEAVREALVKEGIKRDAIATSWKGESDPLVPTADGIREAQNRRVEIKVKQ